MAEGEEPEFLALMDKITRERGFQCSSYKDKCLRRRIAVRMRARATDSFAQYSGLLDADAREYERLVRSLTVNVTKFFRNWETYEVIERQVIPNLMDRGDRQLRMWSAGCSSGEEPYSLAILLHTSRKNTFPPWRECERWFPKFGTSSASSAAMYCRPRLRSKAPI